MSPFLYRLHTHTCRHIQHFHRSRTFPTISGGDKERAYQYRTFCSLLLTPFSSHFPKAQAPCLIWPLKSGGSVFMSCKYHSDPLFQDWGTLPTPAPWSAWNVPCWSPHSCVSPRTCPPDSTELSHPAGHPRHLDFSEGVAFKGLAPSSVRDDSAGHPRSSSPRINRCLCCSFYLCSFWLPSTLTGVSPESIPLHSACSQPFPSETDSGKSDSRPQIWLPQWAAPSWCSVPLQFPQSPGKLDSLHLLIIIPILLTEKLGLRRRHAGPASPLLFISG